jgi:methylenetetrahydrofolate dehydrogenase (NADP+)/methenyltetrahydrofolate cyclohydrolase
MPARLLDGKAMAESRRTALAEKVRGLATRGINPCLAAVTLRQDGGWSVYLKNQAKSCAAVGILHREVKLPDACTPQDLANAIAALNGDPTVHGIIVQSPLPWKSRSIDGRFVDDYLLELIAPGKDVECVTPHNLGLVLAGRSTLAPCTAVAVVEMARAAIGDLKGVETVVVGASTIVGKPVAQLLCTAGATVTICRSTCRDLGFHTRRADLLVVAVGKPGFIGKSQVKPGAMVIDVGTNRVPGADGKMVTVGDVAAEVAEVAGVLTPVPGGVGALTTTILLEMTALAAELAELFHRQEGRL